MTPEQRVVIEEAVTRRLTYPPGALAWAALRKVLEELLAEEDGGAGARIPRKPKTPLPPMKVVRAAPRPGGPLLRDTPR